MRCLIHLYQMERYVFQFLLRKNRILQVLKELPPSLPRLRVLNLNACFEVDDAGLEALARREIDARVARRGRAGSAGAARAAPGGPPAPAAPGPTRRRRSVEQPPWISSTRSTSR